MTPYPASHVIIGVNTVSEETVHGDVTIPLLPSVFGVEHDVHTLFFSYFVPVHGIQVESVVVDPAVHTALGQSFLVLCVHALHSLLSNQFVPEHGRQVKSTLFDPADHKVSGEH